MEHYLLDKGYQARLLKKWKPLLEAKSLPKITSPDVKLAMAQVLESTANDFIRRGLLTEANPSPSQVGASSAAKGFSAGGDGAGKNIFGQFIPTVGSDHQFKANSDTNGSGVLGAGNFNVPNIVMPMLRRIFPTLLANELIGVQPLNGPLGYAVALRAKYGNYSGMNAGNNDIYKSLSANEIAKDMADTRHTGISSDVAAVLSVDNGKDNAAGAVSTTEAWNAYAGQVSASGAYTGVGADLGYDSEFAALGQNYPEVGMELIKTAVDVKTRKLAAHWSPELAEDLMAMQGIDVDSEMTNILTYEIGAEIDRQCVTEMVKAAITSGHRTSWSPLSADGLDQMGRIATLLTRITVEANELALRNRRGSANFAVSTPRVCAVLQQLTVNKFIAPQETGKIPTVPATGIGALAKVGYINDGSMLLVKDNFAGGGNGTALNSNYMLIGYKGQTPGDAGVIYCPYIPVQLMRVITTDSFTNAIGARTRYGMMNTPWDAGNYYTFIKIDGLADGTAAYTLNGNRYFI